MIDVKVWGNDINGLNSIYTTAGDLQNNWPARILSWDPYTQIPWEAKNIQFYSLTSQSDCLIFTSFFTILDNFNRSRGILATSLMIRQTSKFKNYSNFEVLSELSSETQRILLNEMGKIDQRSTDWITFNESLSKYLVQNNRLSNFSLLEQNSSTKAFIEYRSEADIKEYINNPFRIEYKGYREIYFIPSIEIYTELLNETKQLENVNKEGSLFSKKNLTDLTLIVPPREKSYKVELTISATQLGAKIPEINSLHIEFSVNQQQKDISQTEVYKGDKISIIVDHQLCERVEKTFTIEDNTISGNKVYIPIPLTLKPKTVKIQIKSERNLLIDSKGVKITLSDTKVKFTELKPNHLGQYEVEVPYGVTFSYSVSSPDYETMNGRIDYGSENLEVILKRKEIAPQHIVIVNVLNEKNQTLHEGVVFTLKDNKGTTRTIQPNRKGQFEIPVFQGNTYTYTVSIPHYLESSGHIDVNTRDLRIPMRREVAGTSNTIIVSVFSENQKDVSFSLTDQKGRNSLIYPNQTGQYAIQVPIGVSYSYKISAPNYIDVIGDLHFNTDKTLAIVLKKAKVQSLWKKLIPGFLIGKKEDKLTTGSVVEFDDIKTGGKKSTWDNVRERIQSMQRILFILGAIILIGIAIYGVIKFIGPNKDKITKHEIQTKLNQDSINYVKKIDSLRIILTQDSSYFLSLEIPKDSTYIDSLFKKYEDKSFIKSFNIDTTGELIKLYGVNKDSIKLKKDQLEEFKKAPANVSSSETNIDSGSNPPTTTNLTKDERDKFNAPYALQELTKGKNNKNKNIRLELLDGYLKKPNLEPNQKSEYQKRYNALLKIFNKIEECKTKESLETCLRVIQTVTYLNGLSEEQEKYLEKSFEDFINGIKIEK